MTENLLATDGFNLNDSPSSKSNHLKGHVIFSDSATGKVLFEKDNLILMRTKVWIFENLFKTTPPTSYAPPAKVDNTRSVVLFSVGSGGADVNGSAFTPYVPKYSDTALGQPIPFIIIDPDKNNDVSTQNNPSIFETLSPEQAKTYYLPQAKADGTTAYYGKRFTGATDTNQLGSSTGWDINTDSGEVSFTLDMSIDATDARGLMFNEIGLWLGTYNSTNNTYDNPELLSRLTFATKYLNSTTDAITIKYVISI